MRVTGCYFTSWGRGHVTGLWGGGEGAGGQAQSGAPWGGRRAVVSLLPLPVSGAPVRAAQSRSGSRSLPWPVFLLSLFVFYSLKLLRKITALLR